ncbi:MAG TPA: hypothetical protein VH796_01725 [Nitrososphaeraceae archaeon]|jgi:hypothetical protein
MIDNFNDSALQIKSFDKHDLDQDLLCQSVTKQNVLDLEYYIQHKPCSQCGEDHRFKPSFEDIETSIENASELIALFFIEESNKND